MPKQLNFVDEVRRVMQEAEAYAHADKATTPAPRSRSPLLEKKFGSPRIVDDGPIIAEDFELAWVLSCRPAAAAF